MKKIFYSKITKTLAFVLVLAFVFICTSCLYQGLVSYSETGGDVIFAFETDFESSAYLKDLLEMPINSVCMAYMDWRSYSAAQPERTVVYKSGAVSSQSYRTEPVENETAPDEAIEEKSLSDHINDWLSRFEYAYGLEYFVKIDDEIYSNCGAKSEDDLKDNNYFYFASLSEDGTENYESAGVRGNILSFGKFLPTHNMQNEGSFVVCAALDNEYADELAALWTEQQDILLDTLSCALKCLAVILLLIIYLSAAVGINQMGEKNISTFDKVWTEIYVLIMVFAPFVAGYLIILSVSNMALSINGNYGTIPLYLGEGFVHACALIGTALCLGAYLLLVRKLKLHIFLSTSLIYRLIMLCWKIIAWAVKFVFGLFSSLWRSSKRIYGEISQSLGKKTGRYLVLAVLIYTLLIGLFGILTPEAPVFLLLAALLCGYIIYKTIKRAKDIDSIKNGARLIRSGTLSHRIQEPESADLKTLAADINDIGLGLDESVSAKLKAERLKTELITNVSHDLKTPLTSIISYTELLSKVDQLPEEARDYISIISAKSERLKNLTHDLFDISKVQSGSDVINLERLDAGELVEQALAEQEREISSSTLTFVLDVQKNVHIMADGKKLSRVMANLITNILKYSLSGTRVFVSCRSIDDKVFIELKNISSYPMDFAADEIVGRFVRGDKSRTDEGNGLGLAIAKSYVEACGGSFDIIIDGDLFKAQIYFDTVK